MPSSPSGGGTPWVDIIAGLSIAGLLLPEAVAYSGIAGLPPQAGIIGLFAGLIAYGLLGTSRYAIVSATSSSAAVLGAAITSLAAGDANLRPILAVVLVLITGVYFMAAAAARLGSITDFISKPVLRGFAFGLAIVIIAGQCATLVGLHKDYSDPVRIILQLGRQSSHWNSTGLAVGSAALALLFLFARWRTVPGGLIVIALGIAATRYFDLPRYGVSTVGPIHLQLHAPQLPVLPRDAWLRAAELGLALVMVLYSESYGSIRSFAIKHGDPVASNRDLLSLGAANLLSSLFLGMPVGAGYSGTSANEAAGARSRWAGGVAVIAMLAVVLFVLPLIADTPTAVLAAIVIHAVSHALSPAVFRRYFAWHRDRLVTVVSIAAVLWLGVLDGLLVSIGVSLVMMLRRLSVSSVSELGRLGTSHDYVALHRVDEAQAEAGLLILRPDEPLFFANAERILADVRRRVTANNAARTIILSLEETYDIDGTSAEALHDFALWLKQGQRRLILARLKQPVHELLQTALGTGSELPTSTDSPAAAGSAASSDSPLFTEHSVDEAVAMARRGIADSESNQGQSHPAPPVIK